MEWTQLNTKRYYEYINNIITTRGQWNIPEGEYWEGHHIILNSFGGLPKKFHKSQPQHENIIWLYPQEHFIAHKILAEDNPNNYIVNLAFSAMALMSNGYSLTADEYNLIKKIISEQRKGKPVSEETRHKVSEGLKGNIPWNKGLSKKTDQRLQKLSEKITQLNMHNKPWNKGLSGYEGYNKGYKWTDEQRKHQSMAQRGCKKPKVSQALKGRIRSDISLRNRGRIAVNRKKVLCLETGQIFDSVAQAQQWLIDTTGHGGHITSVCNGSRNIAGGYHWTYEINKQLKK